MELREETTKRQCSSSSWRAGDRSNWQRQRCRLAIFYPFFPFSSSPLRFRSVLSISRHVYLSLSLSFCLCLLAATAVGGNGEQNVISLLHLHPPLACLCHGGHQLPPHLLFFPSYLTSNCDSAESEVSCFSSTDKFTQTLYACRCWNPHFSLPMPYVLPRLWDVAIYSVQYAQYVAVVRGSSMPQHLDSGAHLHGCSFRQTQRQAPRLREKILHNVCFHNI